MHRTFLIAILTLGFIMAPQGIAPANAQETASGISGTGTATIKRLPTVMRAYVQISGEGKTLKEALAKLKERRESVKKKLAGLGAVEESIAFDDPQMPREDARSQMERMMRARLGPNGGAPRPAGPNMVRIAVNAHAEWPITAKSVDDLLLASVELQDKIKGADLAENAKASLAEQELREEGDPFEEGGQGMRPGEPSFTFVARIPSEERASAMADAFKKAKANAAEVALAAGVGLGELSRVAGQSSGVSEDYSDEYRYFRQMNAMYSRGGNDDPGEATSLSPGMVTFNVYVTVSFSIK
ncbi:MAG: SIMPL domain-containing protein [Phycisphaeraceae bacterium]